MSLWRPWSRPANEGRDCVNEGPDILEEAAKGCKPLQAAIDTWGETSFDDESTDTPDAVETPARRPDHGAADERFAALDDRLEEISDDEVVEVEGIIRYANS